MNCRSLGRQRLRGGFSLLEMMVAIVILGMGLLMAATMFPVGWTRARDLAEFTTQTTAAQTAATTVRLLCRASNSDPPESFRGDGVLGDTFVHPLHIENAYAPSTALSVFTFVGEFYNKNDPPMDLSVESVLPLELAPATAIPDVRIAFTERVIPPLSARPGDNGPGDAQWDQQLDGRRFAWAVLHKLDAVPTAPNEPRSITMYFVTLRRTQSTHRFARQNFLGPPPQATVTTQPTALPEEEDMLFPVPWLINLKIEGRWDVNGNSPDIPGYVGPYDGPAKGVPSEAVANPDPPDAEARLIAQMLEPGSVLIDRLNGNIYTVKQHRFTGSRNQFDFQAAVTLDREINVKDVDVDWTILFPADPVAPPLNNQVNFDPPYDEDLRDFWVFPPPVLAKRAEQGFVTFDGRQPVVAVETRQMYFSP